MPRGPPAEPCPGCCRQAPGAEPYQQRTLADIILEKIRQKQAGGGGGGAVTFADDADECALNPRRVLVCWFRAEYRRGPPSPLRCAVPWLRTAYAKEGLVFERVCANSRVWEDQGVYPVTAVYVYSTAGSYHPPAS